MASTHQELGVQEVSQAHASAQQALLEQHNGEMKQQKDRFDDPGNYMLTSSNPMAGTMVPTNQNDTLKRKSQYEDPNGFQMLDASNSMGANGTMMHTGQHTSGNSVDSGSRWYPSSIIIEARTFDGVTVNADLMTVIGRGVKANKCTLSERFYLPERFNQNNAEYRAKTIAPIFASACACAGCEVRLKGWEKSKSFLKFVCPQYRRYKSTSKQQQSHEVLSGGDAQCHSVVDDHTASSSANKKARSSRSISRPLDKESTCPFSFLVFWEEYQGQEHLPVDARKGRWFVCATGAGTPYHEGHNRREFSEGELRRKQLQVEGAHDILLPYFKKIVDLVDRDEDKLNQTINRVSGLIDVLKRQQQSPQIGHAMPSLAIDPHQINNPQAAATITNSNPMMQHHADQQQRQPAVHQEIKTSTSLPDHYHQDQQQNYHHAMVPVDDLVLPAHPSIQTSTSDNGSVAEAHASAAATAAALALDQSVVDEVAAL